MSEKGLGSKFIGLFVESDGQPEEAAPHAPASARGGPKSAADLVAELAPAEWRQARRAAAHREPPNELVMKAAPVAAAGAPIDFDAVFKRRRHGRRRARPGEEGRGAAQGPARVDAARR